MTLALADSLASEPEATAQTLADRLKFLEGPRAVGYRDAMKRLQFAARRRLEAKLAKAKADGRIVEGNHDFISQAGRRA